jgi:hypothetical protein
MLANDPGIYDSYNSAHTVNYNNDTICHNGLLIYDPGEGITGSAVNSGGQRRPGAEPRDMAAWMNDAYATGTVLGQEAGPNPLTPEYSYISGDITKAYTSKVSEVLRSMIFMPTGNINFPAVFIVADKIVSARPAFKKTFVLHSMQEPEVNGNVTVIRRDTDGYNGKLTNQTLSPANVTVTKIGGPGRQWFIGGTNYNPNNVTDNDMSYGWGRVEISPSRQSREDYFLNVMYVSDADNRAALQRAQLIETDTLIGARIFDRVAVFNKNAVRHGGTLTFTVPGSGGVKVAVAGLAAGQWTVRSGGGEIARQVATADGGIIYFSAPSGTLTLTN